MSDKVIIEYVFSGTNMLKMVPLKVYTCEDYLSQRVNTISRGIELIERNLNNRLTTTNVTLSALFNAYVEGHFGDFYSRNRNSGFNNLYADSGGLQMITQGKTITESLKDDIYKAQDKADVAFCFDEIPVEKISEYVDLTSSNRANTSSKVFNAKRFDECAKMTAENVKHQLSKLKNAKISYIIQGNTFNDMIHWFDIAYEVLGDDIEKLHGIALADTCMGNGELETCDMLYAGARIFDKYPKLKRNVHLLGIGSGKRMLPAIILCKNGFMGDNVVLSSDSSSQSMAYTMGKTISIDKQLSDYESYKLFATEMSPVYGGLVKDYDAGELAEFITKNNRQSAAVEEICSVKTHKFNRIGHSVCPLYSIWCVNRLFLDIEIMINKTSHITLLKNVTDFNDYIDWRNRNYSKLQSKRIKRKRVTLLDMMG